MSSEDRTVHINGQAIEYIVSKHDEGYYGNTDPASDQWYGVSGPWPTPDEAARRFEQQIIRRRGEDIP